MPAALTTLLALLVGLALGFGGQRLLMPEPQTKESPKIPSAQTTRLTHTLHSSPENASVFSEEEFLGKTPLTLSLSPETPVQTYTFSLQLPGYISQKITLQTKTPETTVALQLAE